MLYISFLYFYIIVRILGENRINKVWWERRAIRPWTWDTSSYLSIWVGIYSNGWNVDNPRGVDVAWTKFRRREWLECLFSLFWGLEIATFLYVDSFFISNFDQIFIHRVSFGKSKWGGSIELEQGIKYENECGLTETTSSVIFDHYNSFGMKISKLFSGV